MHDIRQIRSHSEEFDSAAAQADLLESLETAWRLFQRQDGSTGVVGTARRRYRPVSNLKLHGLCSEPVLTRSGYAGIITYLIGEDGLLCTISDVQPGDAVRIPQAYRSGVSVAGLALPHRQLARSSVLVSRATRSADGRLGGASSARAVPLEGTGWQAAPIREAFAEPLAQQITRCFERIALPESIRPAGSDLLFLRATVLGCSGPHLLLMHPDAGVLRMEIAVDSNALPYRENLTLLARAPGLNIECVSRIDFQRPGHLRLLAIAPADSTDESADAPSLSLTDPIPFHASLGLDELSRGQFSRAERKPVEFDAGNITIVGEDLLSRWLQAIALGGRHAVPTGVITSAVRDAAKLKQDLRPAAAGLLHGLTGAAVETATDITGVRFPKDSFELGRHWLATAIASRATTEHLQRLAWLGGAEQEL
jgi:hypothetical protein